MLQAILKEPEKIVFQEVERPKPAENEVLIKVKRIGVCGSDIHAYYGKHPYISCPIIQGHEFSGQIAEVGEKVKILQPGDNVTVMPQLVCHSCYPCTHGNYHICNSLKVIGCQAPGAAQEYFPIESSLVIKLPEGMSYDFGAMVEPLAVGVHALNKLFQIKGMNLLILGAGPIGNLAAQAAKGFGAASVMITDLSDYRLEIARKCGLDFIINVSKKNLERFIHETFGESKADAILECVGVQETIEQAITVSRKGTEIVVVGVFAKKPAVDMGLIQDKELRVLGTLMYKKEDYEIAIDLIQSGKINLGALISKHFPFRKYQEAYKFIEQNKDTTMKVIIDMEE